MRKGAYLFMAMVFGICNLVTGIKEFLLLMSVMLALTLTEMLIQSTTPKREE